MLVCEDPLTVQARDFEGRPRPAGRRVWQGPLTQPPCHHLPLRRAAQGAGRAAGSGGPLAVAESRARQHAEEGPGDLRDGAH